MTPIANEVYQVFIYNSNGELDKAIGTHNTDEPIIVSEPNRVPTRDQEHKIWIVDGIYRSAYVESKFLSKLFGLCAPMIRKELKHYPTLKWEDAPIEIEIGRVKICYY